MQLFRLIGERLIKWIRSINVLLVLLCQAALVAAVAHEEAYAQSNTGPEDDDDATLKT